MGEVRTSHNNSQFYDSLFLTFTNNIARSSNQMKIKIITITSVDTKEDIKPIINGIDPIVVQQSTPTSATVAPLPPVVTPLVQSNGTLTEENTTPNGVTPIVQSPSLLPPPPPSSEEVTKEKGPLPKAMVKPQVLTHVIEDFVIQESSEPFPVSRPGITNDLKTNHDMDEPPRKKQALNTNLLYPKGDYAKCEACGTIDLRAKFKKSKRFCSMTCAKGQKKSEKKDKGWNSHSKDEQMDAEDSTASGAESSLSPSETAEAPQDTEDSTTSDVTPRVNPLEWTVMDVCDFIKNLPGCSDYADDFHLQEIDGQALMLLKEDHLMNAMGMKLGPALKIVAKIDDMRIDKEPPPKQ